MTPTVTANTPRLTARSLLSLPLADADFLTAHIMTGIREPFEYYSGYGKGSRPMQRLVPLLGVPQSLRRGPPRRGCGEGGTDEDRASRDSDSRVSGRSRSRWWSALAGRLDQTDYEKLAPGLAPGAFSFPDHGLLGPLPVLPPIVWKAQGDAGRDRRASAKS
jgi:hypothetical protein